MDVIGIDPAPKRGLQVFDGEDHGIPLQDAQAYLEMLAGAVDILVTWDAPLLGPRTCVVAGESPEGSDLTQRPIESFFSRAATGFATPPGISVQGYAGCQHWTISRCLLGLPRVGPFDMPAEALPFRLIARDDCRPVVGRNIVEVHPAVATWLWCRKLRPKGSSWYYKSEDETRLELWQLLMARTPLGEVVTTWHYHSLPTDDELDARVAYGLGRLWLAGSDEVVLLGDEDCGAFLVPKVDGVVEALDAFVGKECRGLGRHGAGLGTTPPPIHVAGKARQ